MNPQYVVVVWDTKENVVSEVLGPFKNLIYARAFAAGYAAGYESDHFKGYPFKLIGVS